jgi:hypothetical protein
LSVSPASAVLAVAYASPACGLVQSAILAAASVLLSRSASKHCPTRMFDTGVVSPTSARLP